MGVMVPKNFPLHYRIRCSKSKNRTVTVTPIIALNAILDIYLQTAGIAQVYPDTVVQKLPFSVTTSMRWLTEPSIHFGPDF